MMTHRCGLCSRSFEYYSDAVECFVRHAAPRQMWMFGLSHEARAKVKKASYDEACNQRRLRLLTLKADARTAALLRIKAASR